MEKAVRVLIVDDSAYVRKVIRQMLSRNPSIQVVGAARDGAEALELVKELNPDVVTCDLNMPVLDGLSFVREQMTRRPLPIVMMSIANESGEQALAALDAGAVDFVQKPTALATEKIFEVSSELIEKITTAANIPLGRLQSSVVSRQIEPPMTVLPQSVATRLDVIVIGISTGGPHALKFLIPQLPQNLPVPIVIVMHMPVGFTEMYANRLNEMSPLTVREAGAGDEVKPGLALLAPAGQHLRLRRVNARSVVTVLDLLPFGTPHRPSVDVLFQSAAEVYGQRVLGLVMTGMGADGMQGAAWIKAQGGRIYTEAEETCVVYGMPRAVVEAGLSDGVVPLDRMAQAIMESL
jgi:two-component system chemotaxis response regulator CheB